MDDYIKEFINVICPDAPNLYIASFNEETCIKDATELIKSLKQQLLQYQKAFGHYHVNDPDTDDDICRRCGFDLRNDIHTGVIKA